MEREEAHSDVEDNLNYYVVYRDLDGQTHDLILEATQITIDKIYDDLKSQTCDTCKFSWEIPNNKIVCDNGNSGMYRSQAKKTFSCNEFKRKT